ncbi:MAG: adenosine-specific kinase [Candidatus Marsarchaeota archaeon]|nr:adenosine-specific kinase [Candidatus Marsarchaeota archaeon]
MEIEAIGIDKDEETQIIIGHAGFIKTAEDLYEAMAGAVPSAKFGIAFAEASGKKLVRKEGNDEQLISLAAKNMMKVRAGHSFMIMFKGAFPINVVNAIKSVSEVSNIYCATANTVQVLVARTEQGASIIGIVDGNESAGVEAEQDVKERRELLRKFGYKK